MQLTSNFVNQLYSATQGALRSSATPAETAKKSQSAGQVFARTAASFIETLRRGEETAIAGMAGRADPHSVVTALASAEVAVQTAVTVRDRVVEAYQEILRMPV